MLTASSGGLANRRDGSSLASGAVPERPSTPRSRGSLHGSTPVGARTLPGRAVTFRPHPIARGSIERRVGSLLRASRAREAYRTLGFARFADYVAERLGISPRTSQELMRASEALERLP